MIDQIVSSSEPIAIMGGMGASDGILEAAAPIVSDWVAADGGALHLMRAGITPVATIGDLDSLAPDVLAQLDPQTVHRIDEQDSTDFEKCLLRVTAPLILAAGMLGGRLDHQLVALHALMRFAQQPCILLGAQEIVFLCPAHMQLDLPPRTPVSLFPLGAVTADGTGLEWSFEGLDLAPGARVGTSNVALGEITLTVSAPALLCILPRACLGEAVRQLAAGQGGWCVR